MSVDPHEAEQEDALERLYNQFGPEWAEEHSGELYQEAIQEFTVERLQSYYVSHPNLAHAAHESLVYARSLVSTHPKAALVFAATAVELAIKVVLLKPIVFGLVHTERLADLITELTMQHTGMERFRALLTEILKQFGGVDMTSYKRRGSAEMLWQEVGELQAARNAVIHQGGTPDDSFAKLGIEIAATILNEMFPDVLRRLNLHLHDPCAVCGQKHTTTLPVTFTIPGHLMTTVMCSVEVNVSELDFSKPPEAISGEVRTHLDEGDLAAMRSGPSGAYMQIVSVPLRYRVEFEVDSTKFTGTKVP
jgi:hypothetical protein